VKVVTEQWRHCCSGVVVGEVGAAAAAMVVEQWRHCYSCEVVLMVADEDGA